MMKKLKRLFFYLTASIYLFLLFIAIVGASAPWIAVETLPPLQLLPALLVVGIPVFGILFLLFIKQKKSWSLPALVGLIACIWVFSKDFSLHTNGNQQAANLKVLSFNVKNFGFDDKQVDSVYQLLAPIDADVICFQEFRNYEVNGDSIRALAYLSEKLGLKTHLHFRPDHHYQGVAILSRYPIAAFDTLYMDADNANNGFLATLEHPVCQFRIGNFHLNSFRFTPASKEEDNLWERITYLLKASWETLPEQQKQIELVMEKIEQYDGPMILTADMNAVPHSSLVRPLSQNFTDAFLKKGNGVGWSFPLATFLGVRIDYQWVSQDLEVSDFQVIKAGQSDHYPILGTYQISPNCKD